MRDLEQQLQRHQQLGIALPNKFDDGDIVSWLDSYDVCAVANGWNDEARLRRMPTLLTGRAFAIFQRLAAGDKDTLAHLRASLTAAFLPEEQRGARYSEFDTCSMKTKEAVEVFAHRLESLLRQALPDLDGAARDAVLKQRFIRGMEAPIRLRLYENPALTYAQCVTTARQLQSAVKQLSDEGVTLPSTTSSSAGQRLQGGASAAVTIKAEPEVHANSMRFASARTADTSRNNQRQQQSTPLTCFNCGKVGHKSAQCWASRGQPSRQTGRNDNSQRDFVRNEQQQVEKPQLTCFECGGRGHKQDVCPSRNDASAAPKQRQQPSKPSYQARPNSGMSTRNTITGTEHFEYIADAQADGRHVSCLLDSGAADNFMSFELFDRLFPSREYASTTEDESVRAANGTTMRIRGRVSIEMDFGTYSTSLKMTLLEDLCYDVVLGIGFFDTDVESVWPGKLNMQMNDGSTVRFRRSGIKKTQVTALVCSESVTILPQS